MTQTPADFNADRYEQARLAQLRGSLLGGWHSQDGSPTPLISEVSFDRVELRGELLERSVVALFHATDYPGVQFGRRWRLYDELGKPADLEYAHIHLMEDIESMTGGLPPPDQCLPDSDGVVWF